MRLATLFVVLGISMTLCGQESGSEYSLDVHRVNTEHAVKVTGILYVGTAKYKVQTECFSHDTAYPCVVPPLGMTSILYEEKGATGFLQFLTKGGGYGQQMMHEIVDIEVAQ
jgi:hypothetical protein